MSKKPRLVIKRELVSCLKCSKHLTHIEILIDKYIKNISDKDIDDIRKVLDGKKKVTDIVREKENEQKIIRNICSKLISLKNEFSGMYVEGPNAVCGICFESVNLFDLLLEYKNKINNAKRKKNMKQTIFKYRELKKFIANSKDAKKYFIFYFNKTNPIGYCSHKQCKGKIYLIGDVGMCSECFEVYPNSKHCEMKFKISLIHPRTKMPSKIYDKVIV